MFASSISVYDRIYREFACWAARRAARIAKCRSDYAILLAVEKYLLGEIGFDEVKSVREVDDGGAGAIGAAARRVRVSRSREAGKKALYLISPSAAAHLTAFSCADDSAKQAAERAIQYGALTARNANRWSAVSSEGKERSFLESELQNRLESLCRN